MTSGKMKFCGKPIPNAKNGKSRGFCKNRRGHMGSHGSRTCRDCAVPLTSQNAYPSIVKKGSGLCHNCHVKHNLKYDLKYRRTTLGQQKFNYQKLGKKYTFPCGCTGILPRKRGRVNKFVVDNHSGNFKCRISAIISRSQRQAKLGKYKPISYTTPHSIIRKMMDEPDCERCGKPISWGNLIMGKIPNLHHNHKTGEIYGFVHHKCNPLAMEREIEKLKRENKKLKNLLTSKKSSVKLLVED